MPTNRRRPTGLDGINRIRGLMPVPANGRAVTVACFCVVAGLALMPESAPDPAATELAFLDIVGDKIEHILAFSVLGTGLFSSWRQPALFCAVFLLGYGMLIEVLQAFVPGRESCVEDVMADCAGIALSWLAIAMVRVLRHAESEKRRRHHRQRRAPVRSASR